MIGEVNSEVPLRGGVLSNCSMKVLRILIVIVAALLLIAVSAAGFAESRFALLCIAST